VAGAGAEDDGSARLYQTREEQREAGQEHVLAPWLRAALLAEGEWGRERRTGTGATDVATDRSGSVQVGLTASPLKDAKGELLLAYDTERDKVDADEAVLSVQLGAWELSGGRMYLPFGTFFSHFVSGGLIEFGETHAPAVSVSRTIAGAHDLEVAAYRGRAREVGGHDGPWDGAFTLELWPEGDVAFGLGATSDLADADGLRLPGNRYARRVAGWTGYARAAAGRFQVTAEGLGAGSGFRDLAADRNRPSAWNVETVWFFRDDAEAALRLEGSHELMDAPALQGGTALTWRPDDRVSLTVEYLRGRFASGLAPAVGGGFHDRVSRVGALLSVAF
jgi:hypothetical protein